MDNRLFTVAIGRQISTFLALVSDIYSGLDGGVGRLKLRQNVHLHRWPETHRACGYECHEDGDCPTNPVK